MRYNRSEFSANLGLIPSEYRKQYRLTIEPPIKKRAKIWQALKTLVLLVLFASAGVVSVLSIFDVLAK